MPFPHYRHDLWSPFLVQTADPFQKKLKVSHLHHSSKVVFLVAHFPKLVAPFSATTQSAKPAGGALGRMGGRRPDAMPTEAYTGAELDDSKLLLELLMQLDASGANDAEIEDALLLFAASHCSAS